MTILKKQEVADKLKCCGRQVCRYMERGELAYIRHGKMLRFREDDVEAFLARHRVPAAGEPRPPKRKMLRTVPE